MPDRPVDPGDPDECEEVVELPADEAAVRGEDECCKALVPVGRSRHWAGVGARLLAACCYFAWLGYILAPAGLLLLGSRRIRRSTGAVYHIYAATAWSVIIASLRIVLVGGSFWAGMADGEDAETLSNALAMAHIVVLVSIALLLSTWYGIEAIIGRQASIPWISRWAAERARKLLETPC